MSTMSMLFTYLAIFFTASVHCQQQSGVVNIQIRPLGTIQGQLYQTKDSNDIEAYFGVPYAKSPPQRFKRPESLKQFPTNPFNASVEPLDCARWGADGKTMDKSTGEDCLYLKILAPANRNCCLPVLFWIPGGGFNDGGFSMYDNNALADNFVSQGIILVQVNYRQGPFGFFTTGTNVARGNWGFWDTLEALRFVRTYIKAFGGDPLQITVLGTEAGSVMADLLSLSPRSHGMYASLVMMDGTVFDPAINKNDNLNIQRSGKLAQLVGCDDTKRNLWNNDQRDQVLQCISNNVSTAQLVSAIGRQDMESMQPGSSFHNYFWRPRYDGYIGAFPNTFDHLAERRPRVPTIIGIMKRDWLVEILPFILDGTSALPANFNKTYNTREFVIKTCNELFDDNLHGAELISKLKSGCIKKYVNDTVPDTPYFWTHRAARVVTGYHVTAPVCKSVSLMRQQRNWKVYMYSMDYDRPTINDFWQATGASRFLDQMLIANFFPDFDVNDVDEEVTFSFINKLVNFVKTGVPMVKTEQKASEIDIEAEPYWKPYGDDNWFYIFDSPTSIESKFYETDCKFWIDNKALRDTY